MNNQVIHHHQSEPLPCGICGYHDCQHNTIREHVDVPHILKWLRTGHVVELNALTKRFSIGGLDTWIVALRESVSGILWGRYLKRMDPTIIGYRRWSEWEPYWDRSIFQHYDPHIHTAIAYNQYNPRGPILDPMVYLDHHPETILLGSTLDANIHSITDYLVGKDTNTYWIQPTGQPYRVRVMNFNALIKAFPHLQWAVKPIGFWDDIIITPKYLDCNQGLNAHQADVVVNTGLRVMSNMLNETSPVPGIHLWRFWNSDHSEIILQPIPKEVDIQYPEGASKTSWRSESYITGLQYPTLQDTCRARALSLKLDPETRGKAIQTKFWIL